jgi:hypothetical protein
VPESPTTVPRVNVSPGAVRSVGTERLRGKEAPRSLDATLSVDCRSRVGERREMKRPWRWRRR